MNFAPNETGYCEPALRETCADWLTGLWRCLIAFYSFNQPLFHTPTAWRLRIEWMKSPGHGTFHAAGRKCGMDGIFRFSESCRRCRCRWCLQVDLPDRWRCPFQTTSQLYILRFRAGLLLWELQIFCTQTGTSVMQSVWLMLGSIEFNEANLISSGYGAVPGFLIVTCIANKYNLFSLSTLCWEMTALAIAEK